MAPIQTIKRKDPETRFSFGANWQRYLRKVNDLDIQRARASLAPALAHLDIRSASFLDVGCGSGLFSRAAYELGFSRVVSFDFDPQSVSATAEMRRRAAGDGNRWLVNSGSVLDPAFLDSLGQFDLVYAWGVCHHTGHMWDAVNNAMARVKPGGTIYLALYNDQGWLSKYWLAIKKLYSMLPRPGKFLLDWIYVAFFAGALAGSDVVRGRNPTKRYRDDERAMLFTTDIIDWIGGYPFEVASPEETVRFAQTRGFVTIWKRLVGRKHGCNEFVFLRGIS